ncbi:uncharacterized protein LOC143352018 [Colletes latitarsis]|uniref:uncharacterized protein LOC143352018 n=1 Tax=Colletes latitarsis TaxID=2605962 RepID=UPI0040360BC9
MINISHPNIHGKPPVKRPLPTNGVVSKQKEIAEETVLYKKEEFDDNATVETKKADYNQNIIETTSCSFEQLCNMIDDLEKNIASEIPEMDRLQLEPEKDDSRDKHGSTETYDDIMSFLAKLEDGS